MRRFPLVLFALALAVPASAQSIWLDREHRPSILAEVLFPDFEGETAFPTWAWFVAGKLPVATTGAVVLELPYAHGQIENDFFDDGEGSIGNPYIGYEYRPHTNGLLLEAGLRLPLASEEKFLPFIVGIYSDADRQEAFIPNLVPLRLGLHYHHGAAPESPLSWDLRVVPAAWIQTENDAETDFVIGYGGTLRYEADVARIGGGLTGRWIATADNADFGEASIHQLELQADFLRGSVRPGLQLKLPLDDDLSNALDKSWGFTLTVLP
jgi:hypothetical protein